MHDFFIILVITAVVALQVYVGFTAWKKIDLYKTIIPEGQNFKTVKVYIREDQVKNIDVNYVLNNLNKYGVPDLPITNNADYAEEVPVSTLAVMPYKPEQYNEDAQEANEADIELNSESYIWLARGNEEIKIKYKHLASHEKAGWVRI